MERFTGKSIVNGIAIGKILKYKKPENKVRRYHVDDPDAESERFREALKTAESELDELYRRGVIEVGKSGAMVFETHKLMLMDEDYLDSIFEIINGRGINAEYAIATTADNLSKVFSSLNDEYMSARADDINDISERLLSILGGVKKKEALITEPIILMADDLAPSETVCLDKSKILAFITRHGSANSHTAILARAMQIPALSNIEICDEWEGKSAIVDGNSGVLIIEPDKITSEEMQNLKSEEERQRELLVRLKGKESITIDGKHVDIFANIGGIGDIQGVLKNDADGIGLFRSEFLFLESERLPSEEEQFNAYKTVAESMGGKRVIIRTLDIGADKKIDYLNLASEENPAMGNRAIRLCLNRPDIFRTQLRAIYRASAFGNISVMFPMITSMWELIEIKEIVKDVCEELNKQDIDYGDVPIGIMIETPASVIISDILAAEVDFFSIGTNDLTQYTLAVDRQNEGLGRFFDPRHPSVLKMIEMTVKNAHKEGTYVGICGELAADPSLTEWFLRIGVDELSVSPAYILEIRQNVRTCDLSKKGLF